MQLVMPECPCAILKTGRLNYVGMLLCVLQLGVETQVQDRGTPSGVERCVLIAQSASLELLQRQAEDADGKMQRYEDYNLQVFGLDAYVAMQVRALECIFLARAGVLSP